MRSRDLGGGAEGFGGDLSIQLALPPAMTTLETLFTLGASVAAGRNPYDAVTVIVALNLSWTLDPRP